MARAGRCQRCGIKTKLNKHHQQGRSSDSEISESEENSQYLCGSGTTGCHGILHNCFGTHERNPLKERVPKWARIVPKTNICFVCEAPVYIRDYTNGEEGVMTIPALVFVCDNNHIFFLAQPETLEETQ